MAQAKHKHKHYIDRSQPSEQSNMGLSQEDAKRFAEFQMFTRYMAMQKNGKMIPTENDDDEEEKEDSESCAHWCDNLRIVKSMGICRHPIVCCVGISEKSTCCCYKSTSALCGLITWCIPYVFAFLLAILAYSWALPWLMEGAKGIVGSASTTINAQVNNKVAEILTAAEMEKIAQAARQATAPIPVVPMFVIDPYHGSTGNNNDQNNRNNL